MPRLRARQLEVRDIGGGNEQHEGDGAKQQAESATHFRLAEHFAQVAALELVFGGNLTLFGLTLRDHAQEGLNLGCLDAGPQFRNNPSICQPIVFGGIRILDGPPVLEVGIRKRKMRRHDAHDGHRPFAKGNRATNDGWIAAERALP